MGRQYEMFMGFFRRAQEDFAALPPEEQPENLGDISGGLYAGDAPGTLMTTWKNSS